MNEKFCILIRISLRFVLKVPFDTKSALVQVMAWRQKGNKPLPKPMLAQFTNAYIRYSEDMIQYHNVIALTFHFLNVLISFD